MLNRFIDGLLEKNKSLVLFILIIACNFVGDIYSCELRRYFESNMLFKHLTSLMLFYVFIVNIENSNASPTDNIKRCVFLYILFIAMMRTTLWTLSINLSLIFLNYFIQNYKDYYFDPESKKYKFMSDIQRCVIVINIIITIISISHRLIKWKTTLKDEFDIPKFMLGLQNKECLRKNTSITNLLKNNRKQ